ncbi:sensor histidine kinase [Prosthecobacter dejongeii]|uniref:histidine kinase n=1 Tax=Prosthecobacter dejongeii TaxID=48465 RepID=A0A7W7YGS4_9BACT|nr:ATP-binding protein [Prosthecobacter dejongeii]MBB5035863.1 heavy metal sensor kinase [Prosthecobacter dejongeii]
MKIFFHSLRWRLQAWHGLLLLLVVAGSTAPAYRLARDNQMQRLDKELSQMERNLVRSMLDAVQNRPESSAPGEEPTPRPLFAPADFIRRLVSQPVQLPETILTQYSGTQPGYAYFSVRDRNDQIILQSENAPTDLVFLPLPSADLVEETRSIGSRRETLRSSVHGLKVVVGRDITPELHEMHSMAWLHLSIGLGVWLLGLIGGWWLSGRAIRPIRTISQTAARIAEGNLEERIDIREMDTELGELSEVLNQTFERLHAAFERQRQFTADASHELRTPITILLSETHRLLKRDRSTEEYREALETCEATAQRMRRLVESLLLLARQENPPAAVSVHASCDLSFVLKEAANHLAPLARERGFHIETALTPTMCRVDAETLSLLATNLIANALQHGGNVTLSCFIEAEQAVFWVKDDGPGIAEEHQAHVFERFYRADQARTGTSGHSGLGLAIAKAIVENHGGSITLRSASGEGTCFEVRLPSAV